MFAITPETSFFPPLPVLILVLPVNWRERLRAAVARSGKKHSAIAAEAKISPATLSRILNSRMSPTFDSVVRIAHAVDETVGWLLDERGFALSTEEQRQIRKAARILEDSTSALAMHRRIRHEPNAVSAGDAEVPRAYTVRGARLVYEAAGDSMIGAGIADRDLLFIKPIRSTREAAGRIVICRVDDVVYVRVLDVRAGRVRLLSRNERYAPIEVPESAGFELIGVVVGKTGAIG